MISFAPLRKLLSERKISTYFLRNKCGDYNMDSKTIQRLMSDQSVSTYTLNALCNILECDLSDIISFSPDDNKPKKNPEAWSGLAAKFRVLLFRVSRHLFWRPGGPPRAEPRRVMGPGKGRGTRWVPLHAIPSPWPGRRPLPPTRGNCVALMPCGA